MIRWYFDFISPYAYLQSTRLQQLGGTGEIRCIPVLFAGLLDHWENVGPAEVAPKRDWTFKRVAYLAHRDGIDLTFPAHHPFNPLPLLRLSLVLKNDPLAVQHIFRYVWAEGKLPEDADFSALLAEFGVTGDHLNAPQIKQALHDNGRDAAASGVFGVPTIAIGDELFWGDDATDMALDFQSGTDWPAASITKALSLAAGTNRSSRTKKSDTAGTRLPLLPADLNEPAALVAAIRLRRGGELIALDRLLLYSAPLAEGWNKFIGNVRSHFAVSQQLRELAICTVAVVNGATYEYRQHAPLYVQHGGDQQRADALKNLPGLSRMEQFDRREQLTIQLAEQMTRDIHIADTLFDECRQAFTDSELVELIATIAAYNMVSRFLVALNLH